MVVLVRFRRGERLLMGSCTSVDAGRAIPVGRRLRKGARHLLEPLNVLVVR